MGKILKLKNLLGIQLGIAITIFIVVVEVLIYFLTVDSRRSEYMYMRDEITQYARVKGIDSSEIITDDYVSMKMKDFKKNVIIAVTFIIVSVVVGAITIFYILAGRHIRRLYRLDLETTLNKPKYYPTDKIPSNELGESIKARNNMISELIHSHQILAKQKSSFQMALVSNKLAHEILNPLTIILGNIDIIKDITEDKESELSPFVNDIQENSLRINSLINKFDTFAGLLNERVSKDVSLKELIDEVKEHFSFNEHDITFKGHEEIVLDIREGHLKQILKFLIYSSVENALDKNDVHLEFIFYIDKDRLCFEYNEKEVKREAEYQALCEDAKVSKDDSGRTQGVNLMLCRALLNANEADVAINKKESELYIKICLPKQSTD